MTVMMQTMNAVFLRSYPSGRLWGIDLTTGQVKRKVGRQWVAVTDPTEKALYLAQVRITLHGLLRAGDRK